MEAAAQTTILPSSTHNDLQLPTYGIIGGVNFAKASETLTGSSYTVNTASVTSFMLGVFYSYNFSNLSVQPAFLFTGKGGQITGNGTQTTFNIYYLEVPVDIIYHLPVPSGNFYFGAGPFIAFGVAGTQKFDNNSGNITSADISFGSDPNNDSIKLLDYGANFLAGIKFRGGFLLEVNYDLGVANVIPQNNLQQKNTVIGVTIGLAY
jgi:hypothetical protein